MFSTCMHTDFKSEFNLNLARPKRTVTSCKISFSLPTSLAAIIDLIGAGKHNCNKAFTYYQQRTLHAQSNCLHGKTLYKGREALPEMSHSLQ